MAARLKRQPEQEVPLLITEVVALVAAAVVEHHRLRHLRRLEQLRH
jgi:hypothetical protein